MKNQAIVDEIEKRFAAFKPTTYDVSRQLKAIDAFEVEAVKNAEATKQAVDLELKDLAATLKNIEEARPFEDLTVVCIIRICYRVICLTCFQDEVAAAEKSIDEKTNALVSKGRWMVPGYKVCGLLLLEAVSDTDSHSRRSLAISPLCNGVESSIPIPFVYSSIVDTRTQDGGQQRDVPFISPSTLTPLHSAYCLV